MENCSLYYVKRHRKWWAFHDVPPKLRSILGFTRFAQNLETGDERIAKRRGAMLWLHDWSKRIEEARRGSPQKMEEESVFYRKILAQTQSEEEKQLIVDQIRDETQERIDRALAKAGYVDHRDVPEDQDIPGVTDAKRFFQLSTGMLIPTMDYVDEWLSMLTNEQKTKDMKRSTVAKFSETFPYIQDVNRKDVQRWLNKRVCEEGLTTKTLKRVLSELRSYWDYLRSLELVPEEGSPFDKLALNGRKSEDRKHFEPADVVKLLRAAEAKDDKSLVDVITLGMWTGARIESLCKLRVEDVHADFLRIEDDKTEAGRRDVPIHSKLKPTIKRLVTESRDGYVLTGLSENKYQDRSDALGKRFGRLKTALGFGPAYTFHSLRKTVTTILENAGVPENVAADIVGHEKPRITYGLYSGGTDMKTKRRAIEKLSYPL